MKEKLFEKIMGDKQMREDLIDIVLIEQAKKAKGKPISAKKYFANRRQAGDIP